MAVAFGNSLHGDLVLDARVLILENPRLRAASLENIAYLLSHDLWQPAAVGGLYRPATTLSYLVNFAILGSRTDPVGYHLVNLVLHASVTLAAYALFLRLGIGRAGAFTAAALFAVHPITTDAVSNVIGRADLLATLGVMFGLLCHGGLPGEEGAARRARWLGLALAATLAVFAKESGGVLIVVMLAYDWILRPGTLRRLLPSYAIVAVVLALYLGARLAVAHTNPPPEEISAIDNPLVEVDFWSGRWTALGVLGRQLALLVFPHPLRADYSYDQIPVLPFPPQAPNDFAPALVLGLVLGAGAAAWRARRTRPTFTFLLVFAAIALLPTANLVRLIGSILGERFLYLPLVAFAGLVGLVVGEIADASVHGRTASARRSRLVAAVMTAVILASVWRTRVRNADWQNERALWWSTVQASPRSAKAQKGWADVLFGSDPNRTQIDVVLAAAGEAVRIRPDYVLGLADLGGYQLVKGDLVAASSPANAAPWYQRAIEVLERGRRIDEAATARRRERLRAHGVADDEIGVGGSPVLYNNLSLAYARAERFADALTAYERTRDLDPADPTRHTDVAAIRLRLGDWEAACAALFAALTVAPNSTDAGQRLVETYRRFAPDAGVVMPDGPGRVRITLDAPLVRRHRCAGLTELAAAWLRSGRPSDAQKVRGQAHEVCTELDKQAG